jgi:sugar/nucleoside kinase (ribokinase family)
VLEKGARFLAVNTQANAGNRGYHTVTQYERADHVTMAEHEIRLEMRDLRGDLFPMMEHVGSRLGSRFLVVTRGKKGCIVRTGDRGYVGVPAFAQKVVDRIGAGDAFFAISALAAYLDAPPELIGFVGNLAGALAVEIVGNERSIEAEGFRAYLRELLSKGRREVWTDG